MGGKNSVNNRCRIAKHFRPKLNRSCAYFIGTSSHCVFSNTIQNLLSKTRSRYRFGHFGQIGPAARNQRPTLHVYRSNGGISAKYDKVVVIDMPGPFEPSADAPAVKLVVKRPRRSMKRPNARRSGIAHRGDNPREKGSRR